MQDNKKPAQAGFLLIIAPRLQNIYRNVLLLPAGLRMRIVVFIGYEAMGYRQTRRIFLKALYQQVRVVWPILSLIIVVMVACGLLVGWIEGWRVTDTLYFTFVTGLTIGYGDLTPQHLSSRIFALLIGFCGIILTGLVAAVSVEALRSTVSDRKS
jgi:ion channel